MPYEECPTPEKKGWPSERRALIMMDRTNKRAKRYGKVAKRVYLCRCGLWHVTSRDYSP